MKKERASASKRTGTCKVNENGNFIAVDEECAEIFCYSQSELTEMNILDVIHNPDPETGRRFEKVLNGDIEAMESEIITGDDSVLQIKSEFSTAKTNSERSVSAEIEVISEVSNGQNVDPSVFEGINDETAVEITKNIRVDGPEEKITVHDIMLDLIVGHNKVEKYKQGAYTLYSVLDQRLKEEEKRNPDSVECEVLREVKDSALGLYLRIERGDEELHGHRDGEYSGYFK